MFYRVLDLVDRLKQARTHLDAYALINELQVVLTSCPGSMVDPELFGEIETLINDHRGRGRVSWAPLQPAPGETWWLLVHGEDGHVARVRFTDDVRPERLPLLSLDLRDAWQGLQTYLRTQSKDFLEAPCPGFELVWRTWASTRVRVVDSSHGAGVCLAAVSHWTNKALPSDLCASAEVTSGGELRPVRGLEAKLSALRCFRRDVTRVVVAERQDIPEHFRDFFEFLHCSNLEAAVAATGLDQAVGTLPGVRDSRFLIASIKRFQDASLEARGRDEWRRLHLNAWDVALRLGSAVHTRDDFRIPRAEALGWAAIFAAHAGQSATARTLAEELFAGDSDDKLPEGLLARLWLTRATVEIDTDPCRAVDFAREAVRRFRAIEETDAAAYRQQYPRAEGTLGRALMHAGNNTEALIHLKEGVDLHARTILEEVPRSMTYYATGLRRHGRAQCALDVANRAICMLTGRTDPTIGFLKLEAGRCLVELNRFDDAFACFEAAVASRHEDKDNPRIGGLRGLAAVSRELSRPELAEAYLYRCLVVAETNEDLVGRLGAAAAGDALLAGITDPRVEGAWRKHFGVELPSKALPRLVY